MTFHETIFALAGKSGCPDDFWSVLSFCEDGDGGSRAKQHKVSGVSISAGLFRHDAAGGFWLPKSEL